MAQPWRNHAMCIAEVSSAKSARVAVDETAGDPRAGGGGRHAIERLAAVARTRAR